MCFYMVDEVGFEPTMPQGGRFTVSWGYQFSYTSTDLAGDKGLEPLNGGIKIRCLTNLANPQYKTGTGYGNRTRLTDVKGQCPNR